MSLSLDEAWSRIEFQLDAQIGFWLGVVGRSQPSVGAQLRQHARAWCAQAGRPMETVELDAQNLDHTSERLADPDDTTILWIIGDPETFPPFLLRLNEHRDAVIHARTDGVILEGPPSLKAQLRRLAPDLFSIRAFLLDVHAEAPQERAPEPPNTALQLHLLEREVDALLAAGEPALAATRVAWATGILEGLLSETPDRPALLAASLRLSAHDARVQALLGHPEAGRSALNQLLSTSPPPPNIHPAAWGRQLAAARDAFGLPPLSPPYPEPTPEAFLALPLPLQCEALARLGVQAGLFGFGGSIEDQLRHVLAKDDAEPEASKTLALLQQSVFREPD